MQANCGTQPLIVYLRERMKKATVAAKRRKRWVDGENESFDFLLKNRLSRNCVSKSLILMFRTHRRYPVELSNG
nr:hypothetical protein [uncultured Methanomethylovorans sp.]